MTAPTAPASISTPTGVRLFDASREPGDFFLPWDMPEMVSPCRVPVKRRCTNLEAEHDAPDRGSPSRSASAVFLMSGFIGWLTSRPCGSESRGPTRRGNGTARHKRHSANRIDISSRSAQRPNDGSKAAPSTPRAIAIVLLPLLLWRRGPGRGGPFVVYGSEVRRRSLGI